MKCALILAASAVLVSHNIAWAQGTDVGVTGFALLSFQPVDDFYVGGPYLNRGAGGLAPGLGIGLNAIFGDRFVLAGELTTALFAVEQAGRLAPGPRPPGPDGPYVGGSGTTHLHDTLLSGLVGYATQGGTTRAMYLVGAGVLLDEPSADGRSIYPDHVSPPTLTVTGGFDVLRAVSPRVSIGGGMRVAYFDRPQNARFLGIGPLILRGGLSARIRVN